MVGGKSAGHVYKAGCPLPRGESQPSEGGLRVAWRWGGPIPPVRHVGEWSLAPRAMSKLMVRTLAGN